MIDSRLAVKARVLHSASLLGVREVWAVQEQKAQVLASAPRDDHNMKHYRTVVRVQGIVGKDQV